MHLYLELVEKIPRFRWRRQGAEYPDPLFAIYCMAC